MERKTKYVLKMMLILSGSDNRILDSFKERDYSKSPDTLNLRKDSSLSVCVIAISDAVLLVFQIELVFSSLSEHH